VVLVFVGGKILLIDLHKIPVQWSLLGTVLILAVTMILSLYVEPRVGSKGGSYPFGAKKRQEGERGRK